MMTLVTSICGRVGVWGASVIQRKQDLKVALGPAFGALTGTSGETTESHLLRMVYLLRGPRGYPTRVRRTSENSIRSRYVHIAVHLPSLLPHLPLIPTHARPLHNAHSRLWRLRHPRPAPSAPPRPFRPHRHRRISHTRRPPPRRLRHRPRNARARRL